jgi:hypothetical protein
MTTSHVRWWMLAALLSVGGAHAQSTGGPGAGTGGAAGTGTSGGSASAQTGTAYNGPGAFDPVSQAAARLFGTYRVPGAPEIDPTATYRVPAPSGGGGSTSSATTNTSTSTSTTTGGSTSSSP